MMTWLWIYYLENLLIRMLMLLTGITLLVCLNIVFLKLTFMFLRKKSIRIGTKKK